MVLVIALPAANLRGCPERIGRLRDDVHVALAVIARRGWWSGPRALLAPALVAPRIALGAPAWALAAGRWRDPLHRVQGTADALDRPHEEAVRMRSARAAASAAACWAASSRRR
jgi:hypothetical protein